MKITGELYGNERMEIDSVSIWRLRKKKKKKKKKGKKREKE